MQWRKFFAIWMPVKCRLCRPEVKIKFRVGARMLNIFALHVLSCRNLFIDMTWNYESGLRNQIFWQVVLGEVQIEMC